MIIQRGSTNVSTYHYIQDSSDGTAETGITVTGLDLQYVRDGASPSTKVDATAGSLTAHSDNTVVEVDSTDQPGLYKVDWPDAAFATGANKVIVTVSGSGFAPSHKEVQLWNVNPHDSIRFGVTALPNADADAAGGLPISDAGGLDMDSLSVTPTKNAAFNNIPVYMVDSTDHVTPETGLTLTVERSIDGGAFATATGSAAEIANGLYQFDASAADMNGDLIVFKFTATGADPYLLSLTTTE